MIKHRIHGTVAGIGHYHPLLVLATVFADILGKALYIIGIQVIADCGHVMLEVVMLLAGFLHLLQQIRIVLLLGCQLGFQNLPLS